MAAWYPSSPIEYHKIFQTTYRSDGVFIRLTWERRYGLYDTFLKFSKDSDGNIIKITDTTNNIGATPYQIHNIEVYGYGNMKEYSWDFSDIEYVSSTDDYTQEIAERIADFLEISIPLKFPCPSFNEGIYIEDDRIYNFNGYDWVNLVCVDSLTISDGVTGITNRVIEAVDEDKIKSFVHVNVYHDFPYMIKELHILGNMQYLGEPRYNIETGEMDMYVAYGFNKTDIDYSRIYTKYIDCSSLKRISSYTFDARTVITAPFTGTVEEVWQYGFYRCDYITDIDLGTNIRFLDNEAFYECFNLSKFNNNNYINGICINTPLYDTRCIEMLTIGELATHKYKRNNTTTYTESHKSIIFVWPGRGSRPYSVADERQRVEVSTENIEFLPYDGIVGTDWDKKEKTLPSDSDTSYVHVVFDGRHYIRLVANDRVISVRLYDTGDLGYVLGDKIKYLRLVELGSSSASIINVVTGNKIKAISK